MKGRICMDKGKMNVIIKDNSKESNLRAIEALEQLIKEDISNNDYKSLKYHKMALKRHKNNIDTKVGNKIVVR